MLKLNAKVSCLEMSWLDASQEIELQMIARVFVLH